MMETLNGYTIKKYKTKQEITYDEIKSAIINCNLMPNSQLVIRTIASQMCFSEIPVREALKRLISENFIIEQNSNLVVAPITKEYFIDIIDLRLGLENIAIKISSRKMNKDKINILSEMLKQMKQYYNKKELEKYDKLHREFHLAICLMSDVATLNSALNEAFEHHERCKNFFKLKSWEAYPSYEAHENIFNALKEKQWDLAEKLLMENRVKAANRYKEEIVKFK